MNGVAKRREQATAGRQSSPACRLSRVDSSVLSEASCRNAVDRVASSITFARAEQLRRFVRWLGERSLATPPATPSEREIADAIFNRLDFDPQTDSLVRKEMSRLRDKLSRYYATEGAGDAVWIVSNNGYLFSFRAMEASDMSDEEPCWLVLPFRARDQNLSEVSEEFLEELLIGLHEKSSFDLVAPSTSLAYRNRLGDLRQFADECKASVVVEGSIRRRNDAIEAIVWLVDGRSGRARRSCRIVAQEISELVERALVWLTDSDRQAGKE